MSDLRARDWDVLLSTIEAARLLLRNGDTEDAAAELEKAARLAVLLRKPELASRKAAEYPNQAGQSATAPARRKPALDAALLREPPEAAPLDESDEEFTPEQQAALMADYTRWRARREEPTKLLTAALHALRSYQYGNAATELAREVADPIEAFLAARAAAPQDKQP